jgi:hypothetical protein
MTLYTLLLANVAFHRHSGLLEVTFGIHTQWVIGSEALLEVRDQPLFISLARIAVVSRQDWAADPCISSGFRFTTDD